MVIHPPRQLFLKSGRLNGISSTLCGVSSIPDGSVTGGGSLLPYSIKESATIWLKRFGESPAHGVACSMVTSILLANMCVMRRLPLGEARHRTSACSGLAENGLLW